MAKQASPFITETRLPLVAMLGKRAGYVQLAPSQETALHAQVPPALFEAAQAWASFLETQDNVAKVYWLQFSEVVAHLHWHLYPRFEGDALSGPALFEARNQVEANTPWPPHWQAALAQWAQRYHVALLQQA